jgi:(p)ppGpp synthase/HD superfamily hydrolase
MATLRSVDLVATARTFARRAYGSEDALAHPLEVAGLVDSAGFPDDVVAAALLHDVVEDTAER